MTGKALPGHPLIWVLIVSEVLVFALALIAFLIMRLLNLEDFRDAAHMLHAGTGTLSMALLLTSGYAAALAQHDTQKGLNHRSRLLLVLAAALGVLFLVLKGTEYQDLWMNDVTVEGSHFFTLYALITGFHAAHVLFGSGLLLAVSVRPRLEHVEPSVAFWHMVDLVWVLAFPVLYLVPR